MDKKPETTLNGPIEVTVKFMIHELNKMVQMRLPKTFVLEDLRVTFQKVLDKSLYGKRILFYYDNTLLDATKTIESHLPLPRAGEIVEIRVKFESFSG